MSLPLYKNKQFGIKLEANSGTKETLTSADYGIELTDIGANSNVEAIEKNIFNGSISATPSRIGKLSATIEVAGEFKNSGVLNNLPKIDPILKIARMLPQVVKSVIVSSVTGSIVRGVTVVSGGTSNATGLAMALETVEAVTTLYYVALSGTFQVGEIISYSTSFSATADTLSVTNSGFVYIPSSNPSNEKTATVNINDGGLFKCAYGCASTFSMELSTENYPSWNGTLTGILDKPTWGSEATEVTGITYESHNPPIVINATMRIGSTFAPISSSITLDLGNNVVLLDNLNSDTWYENALVTSRSGSGTLSIIGDLDNSVDLYTALFAGQTAELTFTIGSGSGNQIDIICPQIQYTGISESDSNGLLAESVNIKLCGADKELIIWMR